MFDVPDGFRLVNLNDDELSLLPPMAGGCPDGEGEGEIIEEGAAAGAEGEGSGVAGDVVPAGGKAPQMVPYYRLAEMAREKRELQTMLDGYKKLGDPAALAAKIARAEELSSGKKFTPKELTTLEEELKQVPALRTVFDFVEQMAADREDRARSFVTNAQKKAEGYLKELGLEAKDEKLKARLTRSIEAMIAEEIRFDPDLLKRWKQGDPMVIEDGWKLAKQGFLGMLRRGKNAEVQRTKTPVSTRVPSEKGGAPEGFKPKVNEDGYPLKPDGSIDERAVMAKAAEHGFAVLSAHTAEE